MSTLRISNIEAKSVPASATIDEKVKITNSSGDVLVFLDGKTSGITTVGINTTDANITFDANSNVLVTGIITATKFVGTIEPTNLTVSGDLTISDKIIHTGDTNTAIRFPAADTVTIETAGDEILRITDTGDVTINRTSALNTSKFSITKDADQQAIGVQLNQDSGITTSLTAYNSAGTNIFDLAHDTDNTPDLLFKLKHSSDGTPVEKFKIASGGDVTVSTGNLIIGTAGKGIDFSASAGPTNGTTTLDSELLDDYEEGKITFESNNSGLSIDTTYKGRYTKIGELVTVSGYIKVSSVTSSSNILQVKMPFTSAANSEGYYTRGVGATFSRYMNFPSNYHNMVAYVGGGENYMRFFMTRNTGGSAEWHQMVHSNLSSTAAIYFNVCYTTTS